LLLCFFVVLLLKKIPVRWPSVEKRKKQRNFRDQNRHWSMPLFSPPNPGVFWTMDEKKRGFFEAIVTKKQGYRPTTLYKGNINTMHT
jgi:hypothetical protein